MKIRHILIAIAAIFCFTGCDVVRQASSALNFVNCKYEYNSLSNLTVGGMDLSKGISLIQTPQILALLTGASQSIPMEFTVNLDVTNPNSAAAMMSGMQYILSIDNIQFTSGKVDKAMNIASGEKAVMPIKVGFDLKSLLTGETGNTALNVVKNFIGMGSEKSNVSLQLRPSISVSGYEIASPTYIPINFAFGGKK